MKRIFLYISLTLCFLGCNHKDLLWTELVDDLDGRITYLEQICSEMNTNITSLQTIVDVLQSNDYITGIVEIKRDGVVIGYTITFGKHDPITIYHGQDGKDGQNGADGKDGQDGSTPIIGVAKDTDGVYYWTLNGEWLLDDNGNKLPVSGPNGKNGTTPQLKIEEGYWYVSYDDGTTWTQLGKAVGENGQDGNKGDKGDKGEDGDSMFQSVTQDDNYVYFTLADGTVIKIAKDTNSNDQPNSEFIFTITYDSNGGEGVMLPDTFYYGLSTTKTLTCSFTKEKYFFVKWNTKSDGTGVSYFNGTKLTIDKNIILYAQWETAYEKASDFIDLGLSVKWATCNLGAKSPEESGNYFAWGETKPKTTYSDGTYKYYDYEYAKYTKYNPSDSKTLLDLEDDAARANWGGTWRMPSDKEWGELISQCTWEWNEEKQGYVITSNQTGYTDKSIFLPAAGYQGWGHLSCSTTCGQYWSTSLGRSISSVDTGERFAYCRCFSWSNKPWTHAEYRYTGLSIRPVCD